MNSKVGFLFLLFPMLLLCCKSRSQILPNSASNKTATIEKSSTYLEHFTIVNNSKIKRIFNSDKTLELVLTLIDKTGDPATIFEYRVKELPSKKILKEGVFRGTDIVWHDSVSIALIPYIGMVEQESYDSTDDSDIDLNTKPQIIKIK